MIPKLHNEISLISPVELSITAPLSEVCNQEIFPHLLKISSDQKEIRIWLTGCSTGMEVYSIALCWSEFIAGSKRKPNLRIFSSDLAQERIFTARLGKFERVDLDLLQKETIERFFTKEGTTYTINKDIRHWCVFAEHNTIANPPFQNIDLIVCANPIEHYEEASQIKIFRRLYYAINPTGLILFTNSHQDTIPQNLFAQWMVDRSIFTKAAKSQKPKHDVWSLASPTTSGITPPAVDSTFDTHAKKQLLKFVPPGFVVNSEMEIVRFYGSTALFFQPSNGNASYELTKLIRHDIATVILRLIQRVKKNNLPAKANMCLIETSYYDIDVSPFASEGDDYYMVVITNSRAEIKKTNSDNKTEATSRKITELSHQLTESQEDIFTLKEEYESTNEALRSAYEEIVSANEELQSINGELEASQYQLEEANKNLIKNQHALIHLQQELQLALHAGSAATWSLDLSTDKVSWSPDHEKIYGMNAGQFKGDVASWMELIHQEDSEKVLAALDSCKKRRIHFDEEFRIILPDDTIRWVMCKGENTPQESGQKNIIGISVDVTERNEAYGKLLESERRFEFVSNHAPVMIWMADPYLRIVFTNEMLFAFTGEQGEKELTTDWLELIHDDDKEKARDIFLEAFDKKHPFNLEYRFKRYDGEYRWIVNQGIPRFTQGNQFIGFIGICLDINERVESQNQKDDFIAIASHELKTPVTSLKSYAEILHMKLMALGNENLAGMFMRMNNQIDKLSQLMNKLLDVTKIENGNLEFYKEEIDLGQLVAGVCDEMQQSTDTHRIDLIRTATGFVWADRDRIGEVLSNLLSNAVKYSPVNNTITVRIEGETDELIVSVADSGPGISLKDQENIFNRYYRSKDKKNSHVSGLGLGLFISHEIISRHQGKIWVTSAPDEGATFKFALPKKR